MPKRHRHDGRVIEKHEDRLQATTAPETAMLWDHKGKADKVQRNSLLVGYIVIVPRAVVIQQLAMAC